jgi:hypothetical protein
MILASVARALLKGGSQGAGATKSLPGVLLHTPAGYTSNQLVVY